MIKKHYIDTDKGQIHYRERPGKSGRTVVFLHQTASSSAMFEKIMQGLPGNARMVAFDNPGFGGSFDPESVPDIRFLAQILQQAAENLGISEAHLVGHHTGASIAGELAFTWNAVKSVAMIGPLALTAEERNLFSSKFSFGFHPDAKGEYLTATWEYLDSIGASASLELQHRELLDTARAHEGRVQTYNAVWRQDFEALLLAIKQPLALFCANDDILHQAWQRAVELRPDAFTSEIEGGNFEPDNDPSGCISALTRFWNERT